MERVRLANHCLLPTDLVDSLTMRISPIYLKFTTEHGGNKKNNTNKMVIAPTGV